MKHYFMVFKLSILTFIMFMVFSSCNQKYSEEIAKIDSLQISLNIVEQKLYELDSTNMFSIYDKYTDTWSRLNKVFPDVRDENWETLCAFENIKPGIKGFKKRYSNLVNELLKSKTQLENLKEDLKNGTLDIDNFEEYYNSEVHSIVDLSLATNITIDNAKDDIVRFDSLYPLMEKIIIQYQEFQQNK